MPQSPGSEAGKDANRDETNDKPSANSSDDDKVKKNQSRNKPGKQEGTQGHGRKLELAVTHETYHKPECCAACSRAFDDNTEFHAWNGRYELELDVNEDALAGLRVQHIKHVYYRAICGCGHETREEPGCCEAGQDWSVRSSTCAGRTWSA